MKWLKQSFAFVLKHPRESLILSVLSLAILYVSSLLSIFGVVLASVSFVFIQAGVFHQLELPKMFCRDEINSLIVVSLISVPTNIMMGSVIGLFQGSSSLWMAIVIILVFSILCAAAYILIAHTIGFVVRKKLRFGPALEAAVSGFGKNRRQLLVLSCLSALILLISILPMGIGLVVGLPLHFYLYYFSFHELYEDPMEEIATSS